METERKKDEQKIRLEAKHPEHMQSSSTKRDETQKKSWKKMILNL